MELMVARGRTGGRDRSGTGMDRYTLLYLNWVINKDLLYSTWNSTQCYVAVWMGGESGEEWIHVYMCGWGFPGGSDGKASACNAGDSGSIPELGRNPGEGNGYPFQHFAWRIP